MVRFSDASNHFMLRAYPSCWNLLWHDKYIVSHSDFGGSCVYRRGCARGFSLGSYVVRKELAGIIQVFDPSTASLLFHLLHSLPFSPLLDLLRLLRSCRQPTIPRRGHIERHVEAAS